MPDICDRPRPPRGAPGVTPSEGDGKPSARWPLPCQATGSFPWSLRPSAPFRPFPAQAPPLLVQGPPRSCERGVPSAGRAPAPLSGAGAAGAAAGSAVSRSSLPRVGCFCLRLTCESGLCQRSLLSLLWPPWASSCAGKSYYCGCTPPGNWGSAVPRVLWPTCQSASMAAGASRRAEEPRPRRHGTASRPLLWPFKDTRRLRVRFQVGAMEATDVPLTSIKTSSSED